MTTRWNRVTVLALTVVGLLAYLVIPDQETVSTGFLGAIAVFGWAFVCAYGLRSKWRATAAGRGVMRLILCLTVICTQGMVTILTEYSYPGREVIRPLLLLGIALTILDLLLTLLRVQRTRSNIQNLKEEV